MSDAEQDDKAPEDEAVEQESEESQEDEAEEEVVAEEPKGLKAKLAKHKLIVIAAVVIVLMVGTGAGLYFTGMLKTHPVHEVNLALPEAAVFYEIPKVTVDISPSKGHPRPFIRLVMQAELQGETAKVAFIEREAQILDAMQTHLRSLTVEDLQGNVGSQRLRTDLLSIINNIIRPQAAISVLYKEIMIR